MMLEKLKALVKQGGLKLYGLVVLGIMVFVGYQCYVHRLKQSVQQDIDFIHQTIFDNHPGPCNDQDPDFVSKMNIAYQVAKNSIAVIKSSGSYCDIIKEYLASFDDIHVRFYPNIQEGVSAQTSDYKHFSINVMPEYENIVWIELPTFYINTEQQKELENIIDQISRYQNSKIIVFDVRNNTGGNSQWGTKILDNLFGKEFVMQKLYDINKNIEIDWRASKDNAAYLSGLVNDIKRQFGQYSSEMSEFKAVEQGVNQAYAQHRNFYTERTLQKIQPKITVNNLVTAQIVVLTSSRCVSSCLDFIDEVKAVDSKAILIGETTKADSVYMDVRVINLPSGIGKLQFPIKVYRNRPRGHNVPYVPDFAYPANINSQEGKDQWILQTVQQLSHEIDDEI